MEQVYKKKIDCCGCGVCQEVCPVQAIDLRKDEYGYLYPSPELPVKLSLDDTNDVFSRFSAYFEQ